MAKPHIYFHRGRWTVAGNADVPWGVWLATSCWCDAMNAKRVA